MTAGSDTARWDRILGSLPGGARQWVEYGLARGGNIVVKADKSGLLEFRIGLETLAYTETRRKVPGHRVTRVSGGPDDYAAENFISLSMSDKLIAALPRSVSGLKGVHAQPTGTTFQAKYKNKGYGTYATVELAARVHDIVACEENRPHRYLNFPDEHAACADGVCGVPVPVANLHASVKYRADSDTIIQLRRDGLAYTDISERTGVSTVTIGRILAPLGLGQQPAKCGTPSGAHKHYRNGEKPCEACRVALNDAYARRAASQYLRTGEHK